MLKRLPFVKLALALSFALLATSIAPVRAADPYDIYVVLPLTGFGAYPGNTIAKVLGVIEELTNKQGGIRGRPVHFVLEDDQSSPQITVQLTNGIIAKKVPLLFGSVISAMCLAQAPLVKEAGPVAWCFSPVIRPPAGSYQFTTMRTTDDYLSAMFRYASARGWKKLATVSTTDASGQDFDATFDRVLAKPEFKALALVDREHFAVSDISAAAQVARIKTAAPDAVFAWPTGTAIGTYFHAAHDAGFDVPTFTTLVNELDSQMDAIGTAVPTNVFFPGDASFAPALAEGPVKKAVLEYRAALTAHGMALDGGPVSAWDAPRIGIEALRALGTDATPTQIRDFIANYRGAGIMGNYDFRADPQRGTDPSEVMITRWDKARHQFVGVSKFGGEPLAAN
jgi:branched-chain amino acid transport system substrate-binding protein